MNFVKQSHEIWEQEIPPRLLNHDVFVLGYRKCMFEHIERCGRVCYKSEDKIGPGTAEKFVNRLIEAKHYAMLEHGTVYLTIPCSNWEDFISFMFAYGSNPYSDYDDSECDWSARRGNVYITTNYRVLVENRWTGDLAYVNVPTKHPRRVTVKLTTSRQIAMELLRHRTMSFAMESTRYCNYSNDKFENTLTYIQPYWVTDEPVLIEDPLFSDAKQVLRGFFSYASGAYKALIKANWKPQQAAIVLPNALKADLVVTGFVKDWEHIFDLRVKGTTGAPHPQMVELMRPLYEEFVKKKYCEQ